MLQHNSSGVASENEMSFEVVEEIERRFGEVGTYRISRAEILDTAKLI
jgi:hypothetical protein